MSPTHNADLPVLTSNGVGFVRRRPISKALGWLAFGLGIAPVAFMLIAGGLFLVDKPSWWGDAVLGPVWGSAVLAGIAALALRNVKQPGTVSIDDGALCVTMGETTHRFSRDEIRGTTLVPGRALLVELADGRMLNVDVDDAQQVDRLLSELDLGAEKRRFEGKLQPSSHSIALNIAGFVALMLLGIAAKEHLPRVASGVVFLVGALTMLTSLVLGTRPPKIEVGADGVHVERLIGSVFVAFTDLAAVTTEERTLVLTRTDGTVERVSLPRGNDTQLEGLRQRIALGLAAHAEGANAGERLALLARRDRDLTTWRNDVANVVGEDVGYRALPLSHDDLEAILAAPATSLEHRIGAALALEAVDGELAKPKIRIAADLCAREEARIALEQIAERELEEATLEAALKLDRH